MPATGSDAKRAILMASAFVAELFPQWGAGFQQCLDNFDMAVIAGKTKRAIASLVLSLIKLSTSSNKK
jgi:hypothetical protein